MRKLAPYTIPLLVFAAVVVLAPGFAGAQSDPAGVVVCYPSPSCLPVAVNTTTNVASVCPTGYTNANGQCCVDHDCQVTWPPSTDPACPASSCNVADPTAAADEPVGAAGDIADDYALRWTNCVVEQETLVAFRVVEPGTPIGPGYLSCKVPVTSASGSGTTFYKHYGRQPDASDYIFVAGNYGNKRDHEMHTYHCGGAFDEDCWEKLYLTNKIGTRAFAVNGCTGLGFCPNASFVNKQRGRPYCGISASAHQDHVRNECFYVYVR
jgi:hypothetical protein